MKMDHRHNFLSQEMYWYINPNLEHHLSFFVLREKLSLYTFFPRLFTALAFYQKVIQTHIPHFRLCVFIFVQPHFGFLLCRQVMETEIYLSIFLGGGCGSKCTKHKHNPQIQFILIH